MQLTIHVQIGKSHRSQKLIYVRHPSLQAVQKLQFLQISPLSDIFPAGSLNIPDCLSENPVRIDFLHAVIN